MEPPDTLCRFILDVSKKVATKGKEVPVVAALCSVHEEIPKSGLYFQNSLFWKVEFLSTNLVEKYHDVKNHAEWIVMEKFKRKNKKMYVSDMFLIVNLEPCFFCYSLMVLYRVLSIYFFLKRDKGLSALDIQELSLQRKKVKISKYLNHHPSLYFLSKWEREQKEIIKNFFLSIREKQKRLKIEE